MGKTIRLSFKLGEAFFVFVSRLLEVVYAAGSKKKAKTKHTEHERVQFLGTTEHERGFTRTQHGKNIY